MAVRWKSCFQYFSSIFCMDYIMDYFFIIDKYKQILIYKLQKKVSVINVQSIKSVDQAVSSGEFLHNFVNIILRN